MLLREAIFSYVETPFCWRGAWKRKNVLGLEGSGNTTIPPEYNGSTKEGGRAPIAQATRQAGVLFREAQRGGVLRRGGFRLLDCGPREMGNRLGKTFRSGTTRFFISK